MDQSWGGASGKVVGGKLNWYLRGKKKSTQQPGRKKSQLNNLEKNHQPVGRGKKLISRLAGEKNSSAGWPGEKIQHEFSARAPQD